MKNKFTLVILVFLFCSLSLNFYFLIKKNNKSFERDHTGVYGNVSNYYLQPEDTLLIDLVVFDSSKSKDYLWSDVRMTMDELSKQEKDHYLEKNFVNSSIEKWGFSYIFPMDSLFYVSNGGRFTLQFEVGVQEDEHLVKKIIKTFHFDLRGPKDEAVEIQTID